MQDARDLKQVVWDALLGIRSKITLLALIEIGTVSNHQIELPADFFVRLSGMIGRNPKSIVWSLERLQKQRVLKIQPHESGYIAEYDTEREQAMRPRGAA